MTLDFTVSNQLEQFLADKPTQWSHLIASRTTLRELPIVLDRLPEKHWLAAFRARFISWITGKFPAHDMKRHALSAAGFVSGKDDYASLSATRSAARNDNFAARSPSSVYSAAGFAADSAADSAASFADASVAWRAISTDVHWLRTRGEGQSPADLALSPLWPGEVPPLITSLWRTIAGGKQAADYAPWINWYQSLLTGNGPRADYFGPDLTLHIAQQPAEWWNRPAALVNADIAAWLAEGLNKPNGAFIDKVEEVQTHLIQRPAAASFGWKDGYLSADPPAPLPTGSLAQDFLDEARQKALDLRARLAMTNVPQHVRKSLDGVIAILPEQVSELRPGVLRSRARSLHAVAAAYAGQFKDGELAVDAVAMVFDLSGGLRDLEGCFPELRDIEKEIAALNLRPKDVAAVQQHLEAINGVVSESPVVADSAKTVMAVGTETMKADAPAEIVEVRTAEQALVARNLIHAVFQGSIQQILSRVRQTAGRVYDETEKAGINLIRPVATVGTSLAVGAGATSLMGNFAGHVAALATFALAEFDRLPDIIDFIKEVRKMPELGDSDSE